MENWCNYFCTECFVPVSSLCGVVGSQSWFTKYLIGTTKNILSVLYINAKCIYFPKIRAYTISKCAIVRNVCHVTSTWPFIYWWSGATNSSRTMRTEIPSLNYLALKLRDSVSLNSLNISPAKFIYFLKSCLKHIKFVHQSLSGDIFHSIYFWNIWISIHS